MGQYLYFDDVLLQLLKAEPQIPASNPSEIKRRTVNDPRYGWEQYLNNYYQDVIEVCESNIRLEVEKHMSWLIEVFAPRSNFWLDKTTSWTHGNDFQIDAKLLDFQATVCGNLHTTSLVECRSLWTLIWWSITSSYLVSSLPCDADIDVEGPFTEVLWFPGPGRGHSMSA